MTNTPVAGWYPNPEDSSQERYWDGANWTDEVRPLTPSSPLPPPPTPAAGPPPTVVVQQKSNRGCLYAFLIVLALGVVGCVGAIALVSRAAEEVSENFEQIAEQLEENRLLVEENARILRCEKSQIGNIGEVTVEFVSPFDQEKGLISLEISFIDPDDVVVGSTTVVFENLAAGRTAREDARAFDLADGAQIERCEISDTSAV